MAATPRKDMKNIPSRAKEQPAETAREAAPITAAKGREVGAVDVFEGGASAAAAAAGGPTATVRIEGAAVATGAAAATGGVRETARARVEPAIQKEPGESAGESKEPGADLGGRIAADLKDLASPSGKGAPTRTGTPDDGAAAPAPFRDSGRAALQAQVDSTFGSNDPASSSGSTGTGATIGRRGTPADLGVSADPGGRPGQAPVGIDVFDTTLPATGVARSAGDLGILQGMVPGSGADPNARPSVAKGDATLAAAIAQANTSEAQEEAAKNAGVSPPNAAPPRAEPAAESTDDVPEQGFVSELFANGLTAAVVQLLQGYTTPPNQSEMEQLRHVEDGLGRGLGTTDFRKSAEEQGIKNLETAVGGALGGAKKGGTAGGSQPVDPDDATRPELTAGYMAWRAAGRERLGLGTPLDGDGDVDPAREGSSTAPSSSGPTDNVSVGMMDKAWRQFLVGQPVEGQAIGGGRVDPTAGTRPGDMGNIDYGPDSTGQWSGQTRTDEPEDALNSLGGSGLSIADAQQGSASDSDSESEAESTDSETEDD